MNWYSDLGRDLMEDGLLRALETLSVAAEDNYDWQYLQVPGDGIIWFADGYEACGHNLFSRTHLQEIQTELRNLDRGQAIAVFKIDL